MHLALVKIEDVGSNLTKAVAEEHPGDKEDCPMCHPKEGQTPPRRMAKLASNSLSDDRDYR